MRALIPLLLLLLASSGFGDGGYFGKSNRIPDMPYQRAAVVWRDGQETMVVESTVNSPDPVVSWVLPLPAEPSRIGYAADARLLYLKVHRLARPALRTPLFVGWGALLLASPFLLLALLAPTRYREARRPWRTFGIDLASTALAVFLMLLVWPVYAAKTLATASIGGVEVLQSRQVGDYQVDVVRSGTAGALLEWLAKHETPLPEKARPIVEDYVAKGWCFLAANLVVQPKEGSTPTPLVVTFKTPRPVYPMRLTGLSGEPLVLDLTVAADGTASLPQMLEWASVRHKNDTFDDSTGDKLLMLDQLLWKGSVLTRFRSRLTPEEMREDFQIRLVPFRELRQEVWFADMALKESVIRAVVVGTLAMLLSTLFGLITKTYGRRLLVLSLFAGLVSGVIVAALFLTSITVTV